MGFPIVSIAKVPRKVGRALSCQRVTVRIASERTVAKMWEDLLEKAEHQKG